MRRILRFGLASIATVVSLHAIATHPTQELVFPQLVVGDGWRSEVTILAQGAEDSHGGIAFYDQAGLPLELEVDGVPASHIAYGLASRSARTFSLTRSGPLTVGYAVVSQLVLDDAESGSIAGFLSYRRQSGGRVMLQVGVPPSPSLHFAHIPFDNTGGNRTGMAALSLTRAPIILRRYSQTGRLQDEQTISFDVFAQTARFVDEIFSMSEGERGFITAASEGSFHMITLEQNGTTVSTSPLFHGVLERDLVVKASDTSHWTLRLASEGDCLYGMGQMQGRSTPILVTGAVREGKVHISIHSVDPTTGEALVTLLLATGTESLQNIKGSATTVSESGLILDTGTFEIQRRPGAQFKDES